MHRKKRPRLHRAAGLLAIAILCSCMTAAPVRCAPSGTCDPDRLQRVQAYAFLPVSSSRSSPPNCRYRQPRCCRQRCPGTTLKPL